MAQERDVETVVREMCLWMPESEALVSHGSLAFKGGGKQFASLAINHHKLAPRRQISHCDGVTAVMSHECNSDMIAAIGAWIVAV